MQTSIAEQLKNNTELDLRDYWSPVFDHLNDLVIFLDPQLEIIHSNLAWQHFSGSSQADFSERIYPEDIYQFVQHLQTFNRARLALRLIDRNESRIWFECTLQYIQTHEHNHGEGFWIFIAQEFSQQMKLQFIQAAQQRMLKGILIRMPIMLYHSRNNLDWTMEYVSDGCQNITGHTETELINTPLYGQLIHPDDRQSVWDNIQSALTQHACFHIRYRLIQPNQSLKWVQEIGQGAYSESGMLLGIDGIVFQTKAEHHAD